MPHKRTSEEALAVLLRRAVQEHATIERRLRHVPVLHIGVPGQPHPMFAIVPEDPTDHALRADIVAAMRHRADLHRTTRGADRATLVWLTRSGGLELQDLDAAWHAAARQAYAEADLALDFAVVNRRGWHHLTSGTRHTWVKAPARG